MAGLPNPSMSFSPFAILTAAELNDFVENDQALAAGTGLNPGVLNSTNMDFTTTGKLWGEELTRIELSGAGDTINLASLPTKKFYRLILHAVSTGGTMRSGITFNGDTGPNYAGYTSDNFGAGSPTTNSSSINLFGSATAGVEFAIVDISGTQSTEKLAISSGVRRGTAGAGNAPDSRNLVMKWANTADKINRITITNNGTGDYAIGSVAILLGKDQI